MIRLRKPQEIFSNFCFLCNKFSRTLVSKMSTATESKEIETKKTVKRCLSDDAECEIKKQKIETFVRIKRKNYAMMLGYLGKDYYGMQRNPNMNTIEEDLLKAMLKADLITQESFETAQNINFQRAARTDKGVSAVRQVVSLKLPENPCKDSVNEHLPESIRVFGIKRVTKGFNSKSQCDARTYSYTLPTFAFVPENLELFQETGIYHDLDKRMQQLSVIDGKPYHEFRLSKEAYQKLNEFIKLYEGTHSFHNFTSKMFPLDPRAKRYIMSFVVEEPFIVDNIEYVTLKVKGQSFILHQIRKMVSMAIGYMRNIVSKDDFHLAFEKEKYEITKAPSLGLMLNIVHYDYYNKRYGSDGMHETLDWAECEEEVKNFEKNKILKYVFLTEKEEKSMLTWLANLGVTSYGQRDENKNENKDENKDETDEKVLDE